MVREAEAREAVQAWRASRDLGNGIPVQKDLQAQAGRARIVRPPASAPSCTGRADSERMGADGRGPPSPHRRRRSPSRCFPAAALGATVDRDAETRRHHDPRRRQRDVDDITVRAHRSARRHHPRRGAGLTDDSGNCTAVDGRRSTAPPGSSFAVDLGAGNDRFEALDVRRPDQRRGRRRQRRPRTSNGADVLAGGAGNDIMQRQRRHRRLLRRGRRRPDRGARRERGADLLRRRQ